MRVQSTRPAAAWQEPYDAIPRTVQGRDDLTFGAKCLYGALRTAQNTKRSPTYAELAEHIQASVRSVVRWVQQLAGAGLIAVKRRGQGLPNLIVVLAGIVTSGSASVPPPDVPAWQRSTSRPLKKAEERERYTGSPTDYLATRDHGATDYRATRYGPLPMRA